MLEMGNLLSNLHIGHDRTTEGRKNGDSCWVKIHWLMEYEYMLEMGQSENTLINGTRVRARDGPEWKYTD